MYIVVTWHWQSRAAELPPVRVVHTYSASNERTAWFIINDNDRVLKLTTNEKVLALIHSELQTTSSV